MHRRVALVIATAVLVAAAMPALKVWAAGTIHGVEPQQGHAEWNAPSGCLWTIQIDFWNVGLLGGTDYQSATLTDTSAAKQDGKCSPPSTTTATFVFSGGPNGKLTGDSPGGTLVDGEYFRMDDWWTTYAPQFAPLDVRVTDPTIFDGWTDSDVVPTDTPAGATAEPGSSTAGWTMPPDSGATAIGVAQDVAGDVYISPGSEQDLEPADRHWQRLTPGQRITIGDGSMLRTGKDGSVAIVYETGALTRLNPSTLFSIKQLQSVQTSQATMLGRLYEGIASFYMGKWKESGKGFEVETDRAMTSIKGTTYEIAVTPDSTTVTVSEGVVEVTDKASGTVIDVGANENAVVDATGVTNGTGAPPSPAPTQAAAAPSPSSSSAQPIAAATDAGSPAVLVFAAIGMAIAVIVLIAIIFALRRRRPEVRSGQP